MRNLKAEKYDSIPSLSFPGDNIPELELKDDRLVDIEEYSGGQIICRPAYFLRGIKGALNRALMREKAAEKLAKASDWLPEGFRFCVLAVSYTHLDVYKRQAEGRAVPGPGRSR